MTPFILFLVSSLLVIIAPGPDMIYTASRGIMYGRYYGAVSALGVSTGLLMHSTVAALGLALVLRNIPGLFTGITLIGGGYLIYLGFQTIRSREDLSLEAGGETARLIDCYRQGFISNSLNPKIVIFFLAFLPQFVTRDGMHANLQLFVLGLIFTLITAALYAALGVFAGTVSLYVKRNPAVIRIITLCSGLILIGLGGYMVVHGIFLQ